LMRMFFRNVGFLLSSVSVYCTTLMRESASYTLPSSEEDGAILFYMIALQF
jgi:hypothetical protein